MLYFQPPSPTPNKDRLPEVCCIISDTQSWNFYTEILENVERCRQVSLESVVKFLTKAFDKPLPDAGKEVFLTVDPKPATDCSRGFVGIRRKSEKRLEKVRLCNKLS